MGIGLKAICYRLFLRVGVIKKKKTGTGLSGEVQTTTKRPVKKIWKLKFLLLDNSSSEFIRVFLLLLLA
jgi:hypothetical protein